MEFKKFPSLDNHYQNKVIDRWLDNNPELQDIEMLVTEKIDGSNFQIIIDKDGGVTCGKRTSLLAPDEKFSNWQATLTKYDDKLAKLRNYVYENDEIPHLRMYGELYGEGINGRIHYCNDKEIRIFKVLFGDYDAGLKAGLELFTKLGIEDWWVPIVGKYKLLDALKIDVEKMETLVNPDFETKGNRMSEGVVIEPYEKAYFSPVGDCFILKLKSEAFNDKGSKKKKREPVVYSDDYSRLLAIWRGYFNKNRLIDLFSKEGEIDDPKDMGRYIKLMLNDAKDDFMKEHKDDFIELEQKEQKQLMGTAGRMIAPMLKEYL